LPELAKLVGVEEGCLSWLFSVAEVKADYRAKRSRQGRQDDAEGLLHTGPGRVRLDGESRVKEDAEEDDKGKGKEQGDDNAKPVLRREPLGLEQSSWRVDCHGNMTSL